MTLTVRPWCDWEELWQPDTIHVNSPEWLRLILTTLSSVRKMPGDEMEPVCLKWFPSFKSEEFSLHEKPWCRLRVHVRLKEAPSMTLITLGVSPGALAPSWDPSKTGVQSWPLVEEELETRYRYQYGLVLTNKHFVISALRLRSGILHKHSVSRARASELDWKLKPLVFLSTPPSRILARFCAARSSHRINGQPS